MCRRSDALRALLGAGALCASASVLAVAAATSSQPLSSAAWKGAQPSLAELREEAAFDGAVRGQLAQRLLDRFEAGGDKADLHEALHWIARDWDQQALLRSGPVNRTLVGHCARAVLQWYWLCDGGE